MVLMLSSPYPVPDDWLWRAYLIVGWFAGVSAGAWVLLSPPVSYEGFGLALHAIWGLLLVSGSLGVLIVHLLPSRFQRRFQIEQASLWLATAGIFIYAVLSWDQTLTDSPGSGPRACLLILLLMLIAARIRVLHLVDKRVKRLDGIARG